VYEFRWLSCARKYARRSKNLLKPNIVTKIECKAMLNMCMSLDDLVTVSRGFLEHDHDLRSNESTIF